MPANNSNKGADTFTMGVQAGAALGVGPVTCVGLANTWISNEWRGVYLGVGITMGISAGAATGIEFGLWWDPIERMAGEFWSIEIAYSMEGGFTIGIAFSYNLDFLGFVIVPQAGVEVDIHYTRGITYILHKARAPEQDDG